MATDSEQIIRDFCAAWDRRDLDAILAAMSEDVVYQNVPVPAMCGREAARAFLAPIIEHTTAIEFILHAIAASADGRFVMTERLDRLHYPGGTVDIPLMGTFEIRDGVITAWRDYADGASVQAQFEALAR